LIAHFEDNVPDRRGTGSVKWDTAKKRFGRDGLLPMWVADMDFLSPPCVIQALRDAAEFGIFGYYSPPPAYGRSFIDWEKRRHGVDVQEEWLRFTPGVVTALFWSVQMLTQPGDSCLILTPCYYPFMSAISENGRNLVVSDLIDKDGQYTINFEDFESKIVSQNTKLFLLCSPHNPVGRVWTEEELRRITELCLQHNVIIVSDEIHQDITFTRRHHSMLHFQDCYDNLIVLTSASKSFNIAGLQNSFAVIPGASIRALFDEYTTKLHQKKGSSLGYFATQAAYENGEPWLEEALSYISQNEYILKKSLTDDLPGIRMSPLEGTYLCWIDLGVYVQAPDIERVVLDMAGLAVDFGHWFWPAGPLNDTHIRINIATSRSVVELAAEKLKQAIMRI